MEGGGRLKYEDMENVKGEERETGDNIFLCRFQAFLCSKRGMCVKHCISVFEVRCLKLIKQSQEDLTILLRNVQ